MRPQQDNNQLSSGHRINKEGRSTSRSFILPALIVFCSVFYYFGELVDWAAWDFLRVNFFYSIHDVHRLLFLAPIIYAAYYYGMRATVIITIIALMVFLPRALLISPYPDPLLRMILFTAAAGTIGCLVAALRRESEQRKKLESMLMNQRDRQHHER